MPKLVEAKKGSQSLVGSYEVQTGRAIKVHYRDTSFLPLKALTRSPSLLPRLAAGALESRSASGGGVVRVPHALPWTTGH